MNEEYATGWRNTFLYGAETKSQLQKCPWYFPNENDVIFNEKFYEIQIVKKAKALLDIFQLTLYLPVDDQIALIIEWVHKNSSIIENVCNFKR